MKKPERPPQLQQIFKEQQSAIVEALNNKSASMKRLSNKANEEYYLYWDQFKNIQPRADGIAPEVGWALLKFGRMEKGKDVPLTDYRTGKKFIYNIPYSVGKSLHEIDRNVPLSNFNKFLDQEKDRIMISSLMEEAIASSRIEGAVTTREKAKEMLRTNRAPTNNSEKMVINNYSAINHILKRKDDKLTKELLLEFHAILTKDTIDKPDASGRYRLNEEVINVVDDSSGEIFYTPPPAAMLEERLNELFNFANNDSEYIHPVLKGIILHFWLSYEHPFYDGNGRTARCLFYWFMLKHGYWAFEFLSISTIFLRSPAKYYRSFLYTEYDDGDLTYFIFFNVKAINRAFEELSKYLVRKESQKITTLKLMRKFPGLNPRQYQILTQSLEDMNRIHSIQHHAKESNIVYQTARTDLLQLVEKELFVKSKQGKTYVFFPSENLESLLMNAVSNKTPSGGA